MDSILNVSTGYNDFAKALTLVTAPSIEPVTLSEAKEHLRIDTQSVADAVTTTQSIAPSLYVSLDTGNGTSLAIGASIVVANIVVGAFGAGAAQTATVTIEESSDDITFTTWSTQAITDVDQNSIIEIEYTGVEPYIRATYDITGDAILQLGVNLVAYDQTETTEDTYISNLIVAARKWCENYQERAYITQTWDAIWDTWPREPMRLPRPPLQSVTSVTYYNTTETANTWSSDDYQVDTYSEPGRVSPVYGDGWPDDVLRPMNGVIVRFVAGYGDATTDVPDHIRHAIMMLVAEMYERREAADHRMLYDVPIGVRALLYQDRTELL